MSARRYPATGSALPVDDRARLAVQVARHSLREVARTLQLAPATLLRALAGIGIQRGSINMIEAGLSKIEASQPAVAPESSPTPTPRDNGGVQ